MTDAGFPCAQARGEVNPSLEFTVIPATAGIQCVKSRWIPAFAGMTWKGNVRD